MLQAIAGLDPNDYTSLPDPVPNMLKDINQGVHGLRIGLDDKYIAENTDPELVESVLAGVSTLEGLGATIVPVTMPDLSGYMEAWGVLCSSEALAAHESTYPSRRDDYGPWFQGWLENGAQVTGAEYAKANNVRADCRGLLNNIFQDVDIICCPAMTSPPFPITLEEMYGPSFLLDNPTGAGLRPLRFQWVSKYLFTLWKEQRRATSHVSNLWAGTCGKPLLCRVGHTFEQTPDITAFRPNID
ncbi:MAG: hypothetical protein CM1200mP22_25990 [Dehalococcoidia bacterium]|nr:MAG: hypothetical protein CM1200mP22_25990 [Dehalococcoidia bacterium]